jgi:glycosyltransferase involved in cell wall biosynthesis
MATYNGGRFITAQLRSVCPQLAADDEVVISDDGSTDDTIERIGEINDRRIRLYSHERRTTIAANFENALRHARGDLIILCDQDDVWLEGRVAAAKRTLRGRLLMVCDCQFVRDDGAVVVESFFALYGAGPGLVKNLMKNTYMGSTMSFRRELLDVGLPFPRSIPMHDQWLGLVAELSGGVAFVPEILLRHNCHSANASPTSSLVPLPLLTRLRQRGALIAHLLVRYLQRRLRIGGRS